MAAHELARCTGLGRMPRDACAACHATSQACELQPFNRICAAPPAAASLQVVLARHKASGKEYALKVVDKQYIIRWEAD